LPSPMRETGLQYDPLKVSALFATDQYYMIPRYQRNYSWTDEEVSELMTDLTEAWKKFPNEAYLLGQIIVCPASEPLTTIDNSSQWDLIDGQQRCTTLYLFILIAAHYLRDYAPENLSRSARRAIADRTSMLSIVDSHDDTVEHPRIRVAANGQSVILDLLNGQETTAPQGPTQQNILAAAEEIEATLLKLSVPEGSTLYDEIKSFYDFVLSHVFVVRLSLENNAHALRVFQKVNNRGLELDDADLIKNFLFQKVTDDEYPRMSEMWEQATNLLFDARLKRVKSMEFLMKALIGIQTGNSIPTGNLYSEWEKLLDSKDEVKALAERLPESARFLQRISYGKLPNSAVDTDISTGIYSQKFIQPFEILLAGCHLDEGSYKVLLQMVEDRTMMSYWANEPSQTLERVIHPWAKRVMELDANPTLEAVKNTGSGIFNEFSFAELSQRAFQGIQKLNYEISAQSARMRYILARVNRRIQSELHVAGYDLSILMQTTRGENRGYDLDHIFPKSARHEQLWVQDAELNESLGNASRYSKKIHSIGNLTLLHPRDNREQSDALPWEETKLTNFASSELLVNRLLAPSRLWANQQDSVYQRSIELQQKYSQDASTWGEKQIDERARFYWEVLVGEMKQNLNVISD
jgi:hypothetical protein